MSESSSIVLQDKREERTNTFVLFLCSQDSWPQSSRPFDSSTDKRLILDESVVTGEWSCSTSSCVTPSGEKLRWRRYWVKSSRPRTCRRPWIQPAQRMVGHHHYPARMALQRITGLQRLRGVHARDSALPCVATGETGWRGNSSWTVSRRRIWTLKDDCCKG